LNSLEEFDVMLGARDMSKVQGPDEGTQGTHLPPAAEVEMSAVRQNQDAEAKISYRYFVLTPDEMVALLRRRNNVVETAFGNQRFEPACKANLNNFLVSDSSFLSNRSGMIWGNIGSCP
jgi:hypothetical protein